MCGPDDDDPAPRFVEFVAELLLVSSAMTDLM